MERSGGCRHTNLDFGERGVSLGPICMCYHMQKTRRKGGEPPERGAGELEEQGAHCLRSRQRMRRHSPPGQGAERKAKAVRHSATTWGSVWEASHGPQCPMVLRRGGRKGQSCLATRSPWLTLARAVLTFDLTLLSFPASQSTEQLRSPLSLLAPSTV